VGAIAHDPDAAAMQFAVPRMFIQRTAPEGYAVDPSQRRPNSAMKRPDAPVLSARGRVRSVIIAVLVLAALLALWLGTPLREWLDVPRLAGTLRRIGDSPLAPMIMLAAFLAGGLVVFPVNVLIAASILMFGPLLGALHALVGCTLSAWLLYEIGRRISSERLHDWLGSRLDRVRARLAWRGMLTVALVRAVPIAPYTIVNLAAGAARIKRIPYLAGTVLGMLPGVIVSAAFLDRLLAAIRDPGPLTYAALMAAAILAALLVATVFAIRRRRAPDIDGASS
jgi:phospholipase D1/2